MTVKSEYKLVVGAWRELLEARVNEYLRDGWVPLGGPMRIVSGDTEYVQAVMRASPLADKEGK